MDMGLWVEKENDGMFLGGSRWEERGSLEAAKGRRRRRRRRAGEGSEEEGIMYGRRWRGMVGAVNMLSFIRRQW